jgi:type IV pilus assembly protein PilV
LSLNLILDLGFAMKKPSLLLPSTRQGGFSLLEVLIAVLIFSVGLMGLAGLQVVAMQANQSALLRSIASEAAYDLFDRLRANTSGAIDSGTGSELKAEIVAWKKNLAEALPGGTGYICRETTVPAAPSCTTEIASDGSLPGTGSANPADLFFIVQVEWDQAAIGREKGSGLKLTDSAREEAQQVIVTGGL